MQTVSQDHGLLNDSHDEGRNRADASYGEVDEDRYGLGYVLIGEDET